MKKWLGGVCIGSLIMLLVLKDFLLRNPFGKTALPNPTLLNTSSPLEIVEAATPPAYHSPQPGDQVLPADRVVSKLFMDRNFSHELQSSLLTWNHMKPLINYSKGLPNAVEAMEEAQVAWESLMDSVEKRKHGGDGNNESSLDQRVKGKQCPYFVNKMNATEFGGGGYKLRIPCGLIQGSAVTIIGIPDGLLGSFRIDLAGEPLPGEPDPPIILHYNVRLLGDKLTEDPVIVQNTWTAARDWGEEERCPSPSPGNNKKVDELSQCIEMVVNDDSQKLKANRSSDSSLSSNGTKARNHFPFKQGYPSVMTLRVGEEGIQMTVDGQHITSFAYRERLEPWLVSEVWISGDLKLISVLASGLPSSEESDHIVDLEALKSVQLQAHQPLDLFVGVFSTANNFKRRMAVRRTWMQYPAVKTGSVAVRFFVGLHKNQLVNEELWTELQTYGDIQLLPFVDYYSLITWKTVAICIYGAEVVSAKYLMKTDDDSFVRVDEVLTSLSRANVSNGLLYGLINFDAQPQRSTDSKWYISYEEWPEPTYPPWAHGPGYVVSSDIAKEIYERHRKGSLKMFKLEDVAMGIWLADMKREGLQVSYVKEERVYIEGCKDGYVVAHYQTPRDMLCLWQKLQNNMTECCSGR
ncbi:hypothetical protein Tsubulata_010136 [Turnera subulata]|uniref:Galectin domain-containing protein n=1 Tax=Turnera subulata TaxID=218843 RepID=A0A9Q0J953_9ROSI|nr:hypothetical protein Tsubulata_010136 [Turnera subulata]